MASKRVRPIPKEIYIGPDRLVIKVVVLPGIEFASKVNNESAGAWCKEESTIYLRNDISLTRRWVALREELAHCIIDSLAPPA